MNLFEYRVIRKNEDSEGKMVATPETIGQGEIYADTASEAKDEILMDHATVIKDAGGRKAVRVLVRPFLVG